jgi:hypothetical protein
MPVTFWIRFKLHLQNLSFVYDFSLVHMQTHVLFILSRVCGNYIRQVLD